MVRKYLCLVGTALEVVAEMLESMNDSQEFFVVDFVVTFGWLEGLGVKATGCDRPNTSSCSKIEPVA